MADSPGFGVTWMLLLHTCAGRIDASRLVHISCSILDGCMLTKIRREGSVQTVHVLTHAY